MTLKLAARIVGSSFAIKALGAGLAVAMLLMISRSLTVEKFGEFSFGFAASQFLAVLFGMGAHTSALREISFALGRGRSDLARRAELRLWKITKVGVLASLSFALVATTFGYDFWFCFLIGVLAAALTVSEFISSVIRGHNGIALALAPREIYWRFLVFLLAVIFITIPHQLSATEWLGITAGSLLTVLCIQQRSFRKSTQIPQVEAGPDLHITGYLKENWELWFVALLGAADSNLPILAVRGLLDASSTAMFFVAMKMAAVVGLPLMASGPVIAPKISAAYANGDIEEVRRVGSATAVITSCGALIGLAGIAALGDWLLSYFGPEFTAALPLVVVLSLAQLISALLGPTGFALLMMNHQRFALSALAAAVISSTFLTLILTQTYGLIGAAMGVGSLAVINKLACYAFLVIKYNIHMSCFGFIAVRRPCV